MVEEEVRRGLGPLLAILSSEGVEKITGRSNLSFAQLLLPFCTVDSDIKDPTGANVHSRLVFDTRDICHEGFLLSLTVLPSVLHEAVQSAASTSEATAVFREALLRWAEPSEHEFLRTYIACLVAVSTEDADPMSELSKLVQLQHAQQHGAASSSVIGPAYCAHPKWMLPNTYKYHILVHDVTTGDMTRAHEVFSSMCSVYGQTNCYLLQLNSGTSDGLEDLWRPELERKNRGLESGLVLARKNILSKATGSLGTDDKTSEEGQSIVTEDSFETFSFSNSKIYGVSLNAKDREEIFVMVKEFTRNALTPFVERQLRTMNEQITARRGISRSLTTGVRKWFGAATIQSNTAATVSYSLESSEMQMRRLADLCFAFGLYAYAHQLYQSLKKTFAVDQAWLYHAGALEMSALTLFLTNPQVLSKQYPQHYMENALSHYTTTCMRPLLAMRAALVSAAILNELKLHVEAASQLLKLTSLDNDLFGGILLERSSLAFGKAKMLRKMAFHYVLAGHRFFKAGQEILALDCYKTALAEYAYKRWFFAEDHILYILARDNRSTEAALQYSKELFRPNSVQHEDQQRQFLSILLELLVKVHASNGLPLTLPVPVIIAELVYVVYGSSTEQAVPGLVNEAFDEGNSVSGWKTLEKAAFHHFFGSSRKFVPVSCVTDAFADYSVVYSVPLNERLCVKLSLKNFLGFDVVLKRLFLSTEGDCDNLEKGFVDEVVLKSCDEWVEVKLYVIPRKDLAEFRVDGLCFDLEHCHNALSCRIPISTGMRNIAVRKLPGPNYSCISCKVSPLPYPMAHIELASTRHLNAFCGQIYCADFDLSNDGAVAIQDLILATNRLSMLSLYETRFLKDEDSYSWEVSDFQPSSFDRNVRVFHPKLEAVAVGVKKKLRLAFRAPLEEVKGFPLLFIFYYLGENGICRQERHLISFDTRKILDASLSAIGGTNDLCLLRVRNLISVRDSLLAKVELIGVRSANEAQKNLLVPCPERSVGLKMLKNRTVHLDCEQFDNLCFTVTSYPSEKFSVWFNEPVQGFPTWPAPTLSVSAQSLTANISQPAITDKVSQQFSILWKANIVNTDGTIANVLGENVVEYFYRPKPVNSLPDSLSSLSLFEKTVSKNRLEEAGGMEPEYDSLVCGVRCALNTITHDFSRERFCQFPVEVSVVNNDCMQRSCDLTLRCTTPGDSSSYKNSGALQMVDHGGVLSVALPASSVASLQFVPTTTQPLIISNCARMHAFLPSNSTHIFKIYLSVVTASVYNVTCFELIAQFKGASQPFRVALPYTFVSVVDKKFKAMR